MTYSIEKDYVRFNYPEGGGYRRIIEDIVNLIGNPDLTKRMNCLVDLRSLPKPPEAEDMRKLASRLKTLNKQIGPKISFVVKSQAEFGMMRLFGTHVSSHGYEINIFGTEEKAISWLLK